MDGAAAQPRRSLLTRICGAFRRCLRSLRRKPSRPNRSSTAEGPPSVPRLGCIGKEEEEEGAGASPAPVPSMVRVEKEEKGAGAAPACIPGVVWVEEEERKEEEEEGAGAAPAQQPVEEEEVRPLQAGWQLPEEEQDGEHVRDAFRRGAQVPKGVSCFYKRLGLRKGEFAESTVDSSLLEVTLRSPHDVVVTLLRCAPSCDSAAATTWRVMVSSSTSAQKVLLELLEVLQDWPLHSTTTSDGDSSDVFPLAVTRVLGEILRLPSCRDTLEEHFPRFFTALLFQIIFSTGQMPGELDSFWRGCQQEGCLPTPPNRFAAETLQALLCHLGYEDEVSAVEHGHGWEMLLDAETQHCAMGLLARAMRRSSMADPIAGCMAQQFADKRKCWQAPAMEFVIEFLDCPAVTQWHDELLEILIMYLWGERSVMRRLTLMRHLGLRGLLVLSRTPSLARKMRFLLRNLVTMQEADVEELRMILELLLKVLQATHRPMVLPMTLHLSERLLLLFDHDDASVQQLSICLFLEVMATVQEEAEEPLQALVQQSLLPLFFHLHDEKEDMAQVSWLTLLRAAQILRQGELRQLLEGKKTEEIVKYLLAEQQNRADEYLQQALPYLQSPQESIRGAAIKVLELVGRHMEEKLQVIHEALQGSMRDDLSPSISTLAADTLLVLSAAEGRRASSSRLQVLQERLRRAC